MTPLVSGALGAMGCGLLIVALQRRWAWLVGWGLLALGLTYCVWLVHGAGSGLALAAPLVAGALLAIGEAAFHGAWRTRGTEYGGRQLAWISMIAVGAIVICGTILVVAAISRERSLVLTLAGTVAAVLAIVLPSLRAKGP